MLRPRSLLSLKSKHTSLTRGRHGMASPLSYQSHLACVTEEGQNLPLETRYTKKTPFPQKLELLSYQNIYFLLLSAFSKQMFGS